MVNQSTRAHEEAIELAVLVEGLDAVVETADDVVAAGSLTAAEDNADVERFESFLLASLKGDDGHTIGVGEHSLNLFLVANALSGSTLYGYHGTLQGLGKLGLIGGTSHLKCTFLHNVYWL